MQTMALPACRWCRLDYASVGEEKDGTAMLVDTERTRFTEATPEDDLSLALGVVNGLAISLALYAAVFATWWAWPG